MPYKAKAQGDLVTHRFSIGQGVTLEHSGPPNNALRGAGYKIVRLLPDAGQGPQYRIKGTHEAYERIALEQNLTRSG
jgi:hypothetical protein